MTLKLKITSLYQILSLASQINMTSASNPERSYDLTSRECNKYVQLNITQDKNLGQTPLVVTNQPSGIRALNTRNFTQI